MWIVIFVRFLVDINTLIQLYKADLLLSATAIAVSKKKQSWELEFEKISCDSREKMTKARSHETKRYKSINAAVSDARSVGFSKVIIDFDANEATT